MCRIIILGLVAFVSGLFFGGIAQAQQIKSPLVIKVGVSEYQDVEKTYTKYVRLFQEVAANADSGQPVSFQVAVGTYGEVRDWYSSGSIDVAVLAAMPVAELLESASPDGLESILGSYIGTLGERVKPRAEHKRNIEEIFPVDRDLEKTRKEFNADFYYRTALVVSKDSPLHSVEDLNDSKYRDQIKYIFVRPYSVSGFILPNSFLKSRRIQPGLSNHAFSYQHSLSLERLLHPLPEDEGKFLAAFVYDRTQYESDSQVPAFRRIGDPMLDQARIPDNAVLVNQHLDSTRFQEVKRILVELFRRRQENYVTKDSDFRIQFRKPKDWARDFDNIRGWLADADLPRILLYKSTLDQIIDDLEQYEKSQCRRPRLALVLSGGGAKCAYQAGAIAAIEKRLSEEKIKSGKPHDIDIDLVVGTSGGSINALLVALGITRTPAGQVKLEGMWESFQEKEFFQPNRVFKLAFGLSLGLLQALILTAVSLAFARQNMEWKRVWAIFGAIAALEFCAILQAGVGTKKALAVIFLEAVLLFLLIGILRLLRLILQDWWRVAGWAMLLSSAAGLILRAIPENRLVKWLLDDSDLRQHLWGTMKTVGGWAFPWPLVLGLVMAVSGFWRQPRINWPPILVRGLRLAMLAATAFLVWDVMAREKSLSQVEGVKEALIRGIPGLLASSGTNINAGKWTDADSALENLSAQIAASSASLLDRDLVVTASRLPNYPPPSKTSPKCCEAQATDVEPNSLPADLYFYFPAIDKKEHQYHPAPPVQDPRYISILSNPTKLLNIIVGSSTIYPIFPSQTLKDIGLGQETPPKQQVSLIRIVDGGYIHNSPIDAASNWGATHILLIEASPGDSQAEPRNFLGNAKYAFNFLFDQAQRIDKQAGKALELFQLRPTSECDRLFAHRHRDADDDSQECKDKPDPNLDLFDFEYNLLHRAIQAGAADVGPVPLFERVAGPPVFREADAVRVSKPCVNSPGEQPGRNNIRYALSFAERCIAYPCLASPTPASPRVPRFRPNGPCADS